MTAEADVALLLSQLLSAFGVGIVAGSIFRIFRQLARRVS